MKYSEHWQEDLSKQYDELFVKYTALQIAYKNGEMLCDKPPKPTEPLVFGNDELSEKYIRCFREYAATREVRKKAFEAFKSNK